MVQMPKEFTQQRQTPPDAVMALGGSFSVRHEGFPLWLGMGLQKMSAFAAGLPADAAVDVAAVVQGGESWGAEPEKA